MLEKLGFNKKKLFREREDNPLPTLNRGISEGAMSVRTIKDLFKGIPVVKVTGKKTVEVSGLFHDSRQVTAGGLFFAIEGEHTDGNRYIGEAISRGAVGVVTEKPVKGSLQVPVILVENVLRVMAQVSANFFNYPDRELELVGVTGTNGKTTVTMLLRYLLSNKDNKVGLIGTIEYDLGGRVLPSSKTTPESADLYSMFGQIKKSGCRSCVMEVSSHGIALDRIYGVHYNAVVFLNLSQDHLDFHGDMETYFLDKQKLFTGETGALPEVAVVNIDDESGRRLLKAIPKKVKVVTYGINSKAMIYPEKVKMSAKGLSFRIRYPKGEGDINCHLLGSYNLSNILGVLAVAYSTGRDMKEVIARLETFPGVPGRMEKVDLGQDYSVLVDYAHTSDALRNALGMLRNITEGKLSVVFGCGGNRDRKKRPLMSVVAQELADFAWITADNPRKERLEDIFNDMRQGIVDEKRVEFIDNRKEAIRRAIRSAKKGDCILIAGKGHESYQELADTVIPFDDRQVARECIRERMEGL